MSGDLASRLSPDFNSLSALCCTSCWPPPPPPPQCMAVPCQFNFKSAYDLPCQPCVMCRSPDAQVWGSAGEGRNHKEVKSNSRKGRHEILKLSQSIDKACTKYSQDVRGEDVTWEIQARDCPECHTAAQLLERLRCPASTCAARKLRLSLAGLTATATDTNCTFAM